MHCRKLIATLITLVFTATFSCADENEPLPAKFLFAQATEDQPFTVEVEMINGMKPKRWKGKMVVDGIVTDAIWPERPPLVYKINNRFFLIDDTYGNSTDHVWDRQTKTLTVIGRCHFRNAEGLGLVGFRHDLEAKPPVAEVFDYVAKTGQPRVLYRASTKYASNLIGVWKDGLLLSKSKDSVVSIRPGKPVKELAFDLNGYGFAYGGHAIRGNRALLAKTSPVPNSGVIMPYEVHVAVLDLENGQIKPIGQFKGGWATHTAMAHPSYQLKWITPQEAKDQILVRKDKLSFEQLMGGNMGCVVEGTETLLK